MIEHLFPFFEEQLVMLVARAGVFRHCRVEMIIGNEGNKGLLDPAEQVPVLIDALVLFGFDLAYQAVELAADLLRVIVQRLVHPGDGVDVFQDLLGQLLRELRHLAISQRPRIRSIRQ